MGWKALVVVATAVALTAAALVTCDDHRAPKEILPAREATPVPQLPGRGQRAATQESAGEEDATSGPSTASPRTADQMLVFPMFAKDPRIAQPEHTLEGRIVDASGAPLEGIRVILVSCWLPRPLVRDRAVISYASFWGYRVEFPRVEACDTSDHEGRFHVRYHEGGERSLYAERRDRTVAAILRDPTEGAPCTITVTADAPALVTRVLDANGTPIESALVRVDQSFVEEVRSWGPALLRGLGLGTAEGNTGQDGRCRLTGLVSGPARVEISAPGFAPFLGRDVQVPGETLEVRLTPGYELTGHVIDAETQAPVDRAWIYASHERSVDATVPVTDESGIFRIEHVPGSERNFTTVRATATGYADEEMTAGFVDATRTCEVTFTMHRAAEVRVRCVAPDGAPVPDAIVDVLSGHMGPRQKFGEVTAPWFSFEDEKSADTDVEGRAVVTGLHPGGDDIDLVVRFLLDGVQVMERRWPPLAVGETRDLGDVVLVAGLTLRGTLLDADGRPVAGATVAASPADASDDVRANLGRAAIGDGGRRTETGTDGGFALVGLAPGLWDLYAARDFGEPGVLERGVDAQRGSLSLRLPRLVSVAGRVLDVQGNPVPRVCVRVTKKDFFGMNLSNQVLCNDEGRFELARFAEGTQEVDVDVLRADAEPQTFRVVPGATAADLRLR